MSGTRLSPSRRREDIRAWWAAHVKAQRDSGQSQVAYCRARGLDPKYFTLWKRRQRDRDLRVTAKTSEPAGLIPVVVRADRMALAPAVPRGDPTHEPTAIVALRLSLGNGISLSLEVATAAIPTLVRELAGLRC
jgi:hypothetical protein